MTRRYILFGPPASGKGTQGHRLAGEHEVPYLSTGGMLRREMELDSDRARLVRELLAEGKYVPDEVITPMVVDWLSDCAATSWVLDGFPRTIAQAEALEAIVEIDAAIFLDVPLAELERRVTSRLECSACHFVATNADVQIGDACEKCGGAMRVREDDNRENFLSRYRHFEEHTRPLRDYYAARGKLVEVGGIGAPHEVFARLVRQLASL